jgi:hypothetical protein
MTVQAALAVNLPDGTWARARSFRSWPDGTNDRNDQRALTRLAELGLVERFRIIAAEGGTHPAGADTRLSERIGSASLILLPLLVKGVPRGLACRSGGRRIDSCNSPIGVVLGSVEPEFEIEVRFGLMPAPAGLDGQLECERSGRAPFHLELAASQTEVLVVINHSI